ncbi:MAG TPA: hypothetical protein OIL92_03500 [Oscillospiraceae bacterium]|nr:hypothetical protein [Oscillospiraceae bacterium]
MMTFYQRRRTGKSTMLVDYSSKTGIPIAVANKVQVEHLKQIAKEILQVTIPEPFIATPESCRKAGKYLIDESGLVLQTILGGKCVAMTISDDGGEEYNNYIKCGLGG